MSAARTAPNDPDHAVDSPATVDVRRLGTVLVALLLLAVTGTALAHHRSAAAVSAIVADDARAVQLLLAAERDAQRAQHALLAATLADDPAVAGALVSSFREDADRAASGVADATEAGAGELPGTPAVDVTTWLTAATPIADDPDGRSEEALALAAPFDALRSDIDALVAVHERELATQVADVTRGASRSAGAFGVLGLLAAAVGVVAVRRTAGRVRAALADAHAAAAEAAQLTRAADDRAGALSSELGATSDDLGGIAAVLGRTASAASRGASSAAGSATDVTDAIAAVADAMATMTTTVRTMSDNVVQASRVTDEAVERARATTATVTALGESSREVGAVTEAIATIAEQTNLLALNASIEAARAGEHGRGFAVVANEVKELAHQTARATTTITQRVSAIQETTVESGAAIREISSVVDRVAELQQLIAGAVEQQASTTTDVSRMLQQAATGAAEISDAVRVAAEGAASTTERAVAVRAAADQLGQLADRLGGHDVVPPPARDEVHLPLPTASVPG